MAMNTGPACRFSWALHKIEECYGCPNPPQFEAPLEMILWEIVAYLVDDTQRRTAFEALRKRVGLTPEKILAAPKELLRQITRIGGSIAAEERADRLRTAAQLALDEFGGNLATVLKLPSQKAKRSLMRFPMIGEPGAEKILMFSGVLPVLALESNGVRVLVRVGIGEDRKSYAATYRSVREATLGQLPEDCKSLTTAHLLLRQHGQERCFRNRPACHSCVLNSDCPYFRLHH
jgi:endonuclease-3